MSRQMEWKARIDDRPAARQIARQLATESLGVQRQLETHFYFTHGSLRLCETAGQSAELIWSIMVQMSTIWVRDHLVVKIPDLARIKALKQQMGIRMVVARRRETFAYRQVRIHLDDEFEAGAFLGLQAVLGTRLDERTACAQLTRLRIDFGIGDSDRMPPMPPATLTPAPNGSFCTAFPDNSLISQQ